MSVVENSPCHLMVLDLEGRALYINRTVPELTEEQVLGRCVADFVPQEYHEAIFDCLRRVRESGQPGYFQTAMYVEAENDMRYFDARIAPIFEGGKLVRFSSTSIDITERKRAELALCDNEARFRALTENLKDLVAIAGEDGTFTYMSPAACASLGYAEEEALGREPGDFVHPDDLAKALEPVERCAEALGHSEFVSEFRMLRKDGSAFLAEGQVINMLDSEGVHGIVLIARDITERRRVEDELASHERRALLHHRLEAVSTLASGVAHEINNPLQGLLSLAELAKLDIDPASPAQDRLDDIVFQTQRVGSVVKALLHFSRSGPRDLKVPVGVGAIVTQLLSLVNVELRKQEIELEVDLPENLPSVRCVRGQIEQAILNILLNARDALGEARAKDQDRVSRIRITGRKFRQGGDLLVRLTIEDNGIGIAPEISEKIFTPFFTTRGRHQRAGLGLSIAYEILRDHGGELKVESEPSQWTRLHFELPAATI